MPQERLYSQIVMFIFKFSLNLLVSYVSLMILKLRYVGKEESLVLTDPVFTNCILLYTFSVVLLEHVHAGLGKWLGWQNSRQASMRT